MIEVNDKLIINMLYLLNIVRMSINTETVVDMLHVN
jgi:hypothetical protein